MDAPDWVQWIVDCRELTNLAQVKRDAKVHQKIAGELRVGVHDGLQVVNGDLVQVAVRDGADRVQWLAGSAGLVKVRFLHVLTKYIIFAYTTSAPVWSPCRATSQGPRNLCAPNGNFRRPTDKKHGFSVSLFMTWCYKIAPYCTDLHLYYLCQEGNVFTGFVCPVCLCVCKITQKVMDRPFWNFEGMSGMAKTTSDSIF